MWLMPAYLQIAIYLLLINAMTYVAFFCDKQRAIRGARRWPERNLLWLAALGGSPAAIVARQRLRHKTRKQPFSDRLIIIAGLHLGVGIGLTLVTMPQFLA
jgi:uncharacterized membrane protein YsdA (DUF1294 family)